MRELNVSSADESFSVGIYWQLAEGSVDVQTLRELYQDIPLLRAAQCASILEATSSNLMELYTSSFNVSYQQPGEAEQCFNEAIEAPLCQKSTATTPGGQFAAESRVSW